MSTFHYVKIIPNFFNPWNVFLIQYKNWVTVQFHKFFYYMYFFLLGMHVDSLGHSLWVPGTDHESEGLGRQYFYLLSHLISLDHAS